MRPLGLASTIHAFIQVLFASTSAVSALPFIKAGTPGEEEMAWRPLTSNDRSLQHARSPLHFKILLSKDGLPQASPPMLLVVGSGTARGEGDKKSGDDKSFAASFALNDEHSLVRRSGATMATFLKSLPVENRLGLISAGAGLVTLFPFAISSTIATAQTLDKEKEKKQKAAELAALEAWAASRKIEKVEIKKPSFNETTSPTEPQEGEAEVHGHAHELAEDHPKSKKDSGSSKDVKQTTSASAKEKSPGPADAKGSKAASAPGTSTPPQGKSTHASSSSGGVSASTKSAAPPTPPSSPPANTKGKRASETILFTGPDFDVTIEPMKIGRRERAESSDLLEKRNGAQAIEHLARATSIAGTVVAVSYIPNAFMTLFNTVKAMPDPYEERVNARLAELRAERAKADAAAAASSKKTTDKTKRQMPNDADDHTISALIFVPDSSNPQGFLILRKTNDSEDDVKDANNYDDDENDWFDPLFHAAISQDDDKTGKEAAGEEEALQAIHEDPQAYQIFIAGDTNLLDASQADQKPDDVKSEESHPISFRKRNFLLPNGKVHRAHFRPAPYAKGLAVLSFGALVGFGADRLSRHQKWKKVAAREAILAKEYPQLAKTVYETGVLDNKGGLITTVVRRDLPPMPSLSQGKATWSKRDETTKPIINVEAENNALKLVKHNTKLTKTSAVALLNIGAISGLLLHRWWARNDDVNQKLLPLVDAHFLHHGMPNAIASQPIPSSTGVHRRSNEDSTESAAIEPMKEKDRTVDDVLNYLGNLITASSSHSIDHPQFHLATVRNDQEAKEGDKPCAKAGETQSQPSEDDRRPKLTGIYANIFLLDPKTFDELKLSNQALGNSTQSAFDLLASIHPSDDEGSEVHSHLQKRAAVSRVSGALGRIGNVFGFIGKGMGKAKSQTIKKLTGPTSQAALTVAFTAPVLMEAKDSLFKSKTAQQPQQIQSSAQIPTQPAPVVKKTANNIKSRASTVDSQNENTKPTQLANVEEKKAEADKDTKQTSTKKTEDTAMVKRARFSSSSFKGLAKFGRIMGDGFGFVGKKLGRGKSKLVRGINHPTTQAASTAVMIMPMATEMISNANKAPEVQPKAQVQAQPGPHTQPNASPHSPSHTQPQSHPQAKRDIENCSSGVMMVRRGEIEAKASAEVAASLNVPKNSEPNVDGATTSPTNLGPALMEQQRTDPPGYLLKFRPKGRTSPGPKVVSTDETAHPKTKISFDTVPGGMHFFAQSGGMKKRERGEALASSVPATRLRMVRRKPIGNADHGKVDYHASKDGSVEFHANADFTGPKDTKEQEDKRKRLPENVEVDYKRSKTGEAVTTITLHSNGSNSEASASSCTQC